ncbi:MAG TPA: hypothetical protein VFN30_00925 [Chitinophagaceae bacterium]|nr:hypothetical protein [Chitinophagaceae bacterium]
MRQNIIFGSSLFVIFFNGCEPAATFDKPQPDNIKYLTAFPERVQGKYIAGDQASTVTITDKVITNHYDFDLKEHKDSLGSSYKLEGDTLVNLTDNTKVKILIEGDTIVQHFKETDTLFNISADNVLKKFKGYYFLSNRYSDNAWEVKKLSLKKGVLIIASISDKEDIQKLREITEAATDTISTRFTLTKRQIKKFVQKGGFAEQEVFTRVTINSRQR